MSIADTNAWCTTQTLPGCGTVAHARAQGTLRLTMPSSEPTASMQSSYSLIHCSDVTREAPAAGPPPFANLRVRRPSS